MARHGIIFYASLLLSGGLYILLGYFIERHQTVPLISSFIALFIIYLYVTKTYRQSWQQLIIVSLIFRVLLLLSFPALSDDIYRFIWDGRLTANGINPFTGLPSFYLDKALPGLTAELYDHLNSPQYYTVYPPFAQLIFYVAVKVFPESVWGSAIVIRLFILMAEALSLFLIIKLLQRYNVHRENALLYALNPLVIIELTGNLHFEAFVICFLLLSVWLFVQRKEIPSASVFALSVAAKLIPLIFLPVFFKHLKLKKLVFFCLVVAGVVIIAFIPMLDASFIEGMGSSLLLYFQKFEFNASIYYLIREVGFAVKGYNIIAASGPWLAVIAFGAILGYTFLSDRSSLPEQLMWVLLIYLGLATTVHPWYIITALALSVFTSYRFVILWSGLIFLTYTGYGLTGYFENLWITATEYLVLAAYMIYEIRNEKTAQPLVTGM